MPLSPPLENELPSPPSGGILAADTMLVISGMGNMLYQARGLHQTLDVIKAASHQARTVNGGLIDISAPQFRKYSSKITCTDVNAPPLDNLWPGMQVTVHCAASLCYVTGNPGSPARPEVSGSSWTEGEYTFYRPILNMLIVSLNDSFDEWKSDNQWEMELEEV